MPEALKRHPLLFILAAALALRLVAAIGVQNYLDDVGRQFLIPGDAEGYWMLAGKIAAGEQYTVYDPPRRVLRMPGFPLLLAGVRSTLGESFLATRLVLAVVGTAACAAVYFLGATLDSPPTGLIAAALATFWPVLIGFSVLVLSETFFALLLVASLVAMAWLVKGSSSKNSTGRMSKRTVAIAALVGVMITLASYVRPTWLPAAGVFPIAYWLAGERTAASVLVALTVAAAAIVTLAPWTIRNRLVTGHWVPTTLWVGPSLYDGLSETATGESDMRFFDEDQLLSRMSEYDMDREYRKRAWNFVRQHPGGTMQLAGSKLWRFLRPWPGAEQFSSPLARILVAAYYVPVFLLALVGTWVRRHDLWLCGLSWAPFVLFAAVHCVFVSSLRYRLPAEYPLCLMAAVGLQWVLRVGSAATQDRLPPPVAS